jgi:SHS2 domain-containing protein
VGSYEVLEHTADIGLRARAADLEDLFQTAARGMATIAGVYRPGAGEDVAVELESSDLEGLLVDWLNEVLYQHDSRGAAVTGVKVRDLEDSRLKGILQIAPLDERDEEGIQIKAVTYHQIDVSRIGGGRDEDGWEATVFFDV